MLTTTSGDRGPIDPEYFSLTVRQALRGQVAPDEYLDDSLAAVTGTVPAELTSEDFAALALHPGVIDAGVAVVDAEVAVLAAEDAGAPDELAMRRLDKARARQLSVLKQLQVRRAMAHTTRARSRVAQVVPLRAVAGGAA